MGGQKRFAFEIKKVAIGHEQESNSRGVAKADFRCQLESRRSHSVPQIAIERRRRTFVHERPTVRLDGNILVELDRVALLVAESLKLDHARIWHPPIGCDR